MNSPTAAAAPRDENVAIVPHKLRDDAIIEALCLLQYEAKELPEVIIGRLSDETKWKGFIPARLPLADIPFPFRKSDPNLAMQPTLELRSADGTRLVRMGENVISYHVVGAKKYCGWKQFRPELIGVIETLFDKLSGPEIKKISFRYVNAIGGERHLIGSVHDLNLDVRVDGIKLEGPINLNYIASTPTHIVTSRVAHTDFVQVQGGSLPPGTKAIVDVEVTTPNKFTAPDVRTAMDWIDEAHALEKQAFFRLIPRDVLKKLTEE